MPDNSKNTPITDKQRQFCEQYIIDLNATQAAIRAGYSEKSASRIAVELLAKPHIAEYLHDLKKKRSERTQITADRVLKELARIGFANIDDVLTFGNDDITIRESGSLKRSVKAAIAEVSKTISKQGVTVTVKMHNKVSALTKILDHVSEKEEPGSQIMQPPSIEIIEEDMSGSAESSGKD